MTRPLAKPFTGIPAGRHIRLAGWVIVPAVIVFLLFLLFSRKARGLF